MSFERPRPAALGPRRLVRHGDDAPVIVTVNPTGTGLVRNSPTWLIELSVLANMREPSTRPSTRGRGDTRSFRERPCNDLIASNHEPSTQAPQESGPATVESSLVGWRIHDPWRTPGTVTSLKKAPTAEHGVAVSTNTSSPSNVTDRCAEKLTLRSSPSQPGRRRIEPHGACVEGD